MDATAGDQALKDERTTFTKDGKKADGFASASVPTLEEKTIARLAATSPPIREEMLKPHSDDEAKTVDGQRFGAPADADETDSHPPAGAGQVLSPDEEAAPAARSVLRKHLASKLGHNTWTVPTPRPHVDPNGFEDPIADSFWKEVWIAGAVHNVSSPYVYWSYPRIIMLCRPRSTGKSSIPSQMI